MPRRKSPATEGNVWERLYKPNAKRETARKVAAEVRERMSNPPKMQHGLFQAPPPACVCEPYRDPLSGLMMDPYEQRHKKPAPKGGKSKFKNEKPFLGHGRKSGKTREVYFDQEGKPLASLEPYVEAHNGDRVARRLNKKAMWADRKVFNPAGGKIAPANLFLQPVENDAHHEQYRERMSARLKEERIKKMSVPKKTEVVTGPRNCILSQSKRGGYGVPCTTLGELYGDELETRHLVYPEPCTEDALRANQRAEKQRHLKTMEEKRAFCSMHRRRKAPFTDDRQQYNDTEAVLLARQSGQSRRGGSRARRKAGGDGDGDVDGDAEGGGKSEGVTKQRPKSAPPGRASGKENHRGIAGGAPSDDRPVFKPSGGTRSGSNYSTFESYYAPDKRNTHVMPDYGYGKHRRRSSSRNRRNPHPQIQNDTEGASFWKPPSQNRTTPSVPVSTMGSNIRQFL